MLIVIPVMVVIAVIAVALFVSRTPLVGEVQAQETPVTMRSLLERLRARMDSDPSFTVSIHFVNPPIPGEPAWAIPIVLSEEGSSRRFGEIGDDYVCFLEQGQTFNNSVCVLYTNISMVVYQN
jgi:hypothetical protein